MKVNGKEIEKRMIRYLGRSIQVYTKDDDKFYFKAYALNKEKRYILGTTKRIIKESSK